MIRNIFCLALLCAVAACAKPEEEVATTADTAVETSQPAAPQTASASSQKACEVLTPAELKETTGIEGTGTPSVSGGADVCSWYSPNGNLVLQLFPYASSYEDAREAFEGLFETKAAAHTGVGDKAYYLSGKMSGMDTGTLVAAKGAKSISVQMIAGEGAKHKAQLTDVANLVLSKM